MRHALASLCLTWVCVGCTSVPTNRTVSLPATPSAFKEISAPSIAIAAAPAETPTRGAWWKAFADPVLHDLIERANTHNTSIALAAAKLAQARALLRTADASRSLQLDLNAGASRQGGPLVNAAGSNGTLISTTANLSYEVDLFGRLASGRDAASLDAQARQALLQSAQLLVQAEVAQTYLSLRGLDAERALMRETTAAYGQTLQISERRFQNGTISELDLMRVRSELTFVESETLLLDRRRAELEHALAVLVGEVASRFTLEAAPATMDLPLPVIPAGVPSTVLARRPDVAAAGRSMQAAQARVGVAHAAWFPTFTLTGSGGYASPVLADLFKMSMRAWSLGALATLPLLDGGKREAGEANANAELDASLASYREQILVAFRDVEDQLSALRVLADNADVQSRAVAIASRTALLSGSRYRSGLSSQLDWLDAERTELRSRRQAVQVRSAQYVATVGLVRALGGGWE
jgi:outer membrane protein, multidrug efflux system